MLELLISSPTKTEAILFFTETESAIFYYNTQTKLLLTVYKNFFFNFYKDYYKRLYLYRTKMHPMFFVGQFRNFVCWRNINHEKTTTVHILDGHGVKQILSEQSYYYPE